jgi:diguanylate cyclase (GGDEF)-like protein/PAS domain S-box-containing protein
MIVLTEATMSAGAPQAAEIILDAIGDAVLSTDADGLVTYLNPVAEAMTGWSRAQAAGRRLEDVFHIIDSETRLVARNPLNLAVLLDKPVGLTPHCLLVHRDGHEAEIEDCATPIHGHAGEVSGAVIVFRGVGAALETSRQMARLAQHDALTGLPNRMLLTDRLCEAIALARRRRKSVGVIFVDVDIFKVINDLHGHDVGDLVLCAVGARLRGALRQSDTVARFGGDEFVVILSELERSEHALVVAAKLQRALAPGHRVGELQITVSASLGIAVFPDHGDDVGLLISRADIAMYRAKRQGAGGCEQFDPDRGSGADAYAVRIASGAEVGLPNSGAR